MAKLPILGVTRQERGWAGHYILARRCLFRRNTLLTCENGVRVVISTVGNLMSLDAICTQRGARVMQEPATPATWIEMIGVDHYFETMAFYADHSEFNDADVSRRVILDSSPWMIKEPWQEQAADSMHEAAVAEITRKLAEGWFFSPPDVKDEKR